MLDSSQRRSPAPGNPPRKVPVSSPDLWERVAPGSAATSVGAMAALLGSIRQINPVLIQEWDAITLGLGVAGGLAGWWLGRGLGRLGRGGHGAGAAAERLRRRVVAGLALLGGALLAGFALAVFGLPASRRWDMVGGALLAVLVLSLGGLGLWRLSRVFGRPDDPGEGTG
jgi:hypothetical protein